MIKQLSHLLSIRPVSLIFYFVLFECFWGLSSIDENTNGFVFKKKRNNSRKETDHYHFSTPFTDHLGEKDIHFREV